MGIKIRDEIIEREFYDELCGQEVYMEEITVSFNSVTDTGFIKQEDNIINLTCSQMQQLAEILEVMKHA